MIFFSYFSKDFLKSLITKKLAKKNTDIFYFFKNLLMSEHVYIIGDKEEYRAFFKKYKKVRNEEDYPFRNIFLQNSKWLNNQKLNTTYFEKINIDYYFDIEKNFDKKKNIINFFPIETVSEWNHDYFIKDLSKKSDLPFELKIKANQSTSVLEKTKQYLDFVSCLEKLASFSGSIIIYDKYISSQLIFIKADGSVDYNYTLGKAYNDTLSFFSDKVLGKSLNQNIHCKIICIFDPKQNKIIDSDKKIENSKKYRDYSNNFFSNLGKHNGSMHIKDGNKSPDKDDDYEKLFDLLHDRYFLFFDDNKNLLRMINFKNGFDFIKKKAKVTKNYMFTPEKKSSYEAAVMPKIEVLKEEQYDMFHLQNSA